MKDSSGYKTALKSTGLFGGVQVLKIVINVIRFKIVTLLLGSVGFGLIGIYTGIVTTIQSLSSLGLASSAVRDVAILENKNQDSKHRFLTALYRWFLSTGFVGMLLTVLLSPWISEFTFGNKNYITPIALLSLAIFFQTMSNGEVAVLQGLRDYRAIAMINVGGAFLGLLVSVPLYYIYGISGLAISLVISAGMLWGMSHFYYRRRGFPLIKQKISETFALGTPTLKLGITLSVTAVTVSLVDLAVKACITRWSDVGMVGLYQAAFTLNSSYIGVVLTAMATDYYPRLSKASENEQKVSAVVTEQTEIALTILAPLICVIITFLPIIIRILYSEDFLQIVPMTRIMLLGSFFKATSWALSYMFLAKGNGKKFLINELLINAISFSTMVLFYYYFSLRGLGIAFTLNFIIYFIIVYISAKKDYNFAFPSQFWTLFLKYTAVILGTFFLFETSGYTILSYTLGAALCSLTLYLVLKDLDRRMNVKEMFKKFRK